MAGTTWNRYSGRYCGVASNHNAKPVAAAAASSDHRLATIRSTPTGPWISFKATAAPRPMPPHHRSLTQPKSQTPDRPSNTGLICPSSTLPFMPKVSATATSRVASCQSPTRSARRVHQRNKASDRLRTMMTAIPSKCPLTPTPGCSSHASSGGMTYCGPVGWKQAVVLQRSYGSSPAAIRPAALI